MGHISQCANPECNTEMETALPRHDWFCSRECRMAMTKQISRDDVEALCKKLRKEAENNPSIRVFTSQLDAIPMLLSLWEARDECERQFQEKVSEIGRLMDQLAAANERAEKAERQCEYSWGVIANAYEGDWGKAPDDWQGMAALCEWPRPAEIQKLLAETDQ